jgi:hypothetical protein
MYSGKIAVPTDGGEIKKLSLCLQFYLKLNNYNHKSNKDGQNTEQRRLFDREKSCSIKFRTILRYYESR